MSVSNCRVSHAQDQSQWKGQGQSQNQEAIHDHVQDQDQEEQNVPDRIQEEVQDVTPDHIPDHIHVQDLDLHPPDIDLDQGHQTEEADPGLPILLEGTDVATEEGKIYG